MSVLQARESERKTLIQELQLLDRAADLVRVDVRAVEKALRSKLDEWKGLLRRHPSRSRQLLKKLLCGPVLFTDRRDEGCYEFKATLSFGALMSGTVLASMVASPRARQNGRQRWLFAGRATRAA